MFLDEVYKYFVSTFIIGCGFFISYKIVDKFVYQPMLIEGEISDEELSEEELRERKVAQYSNNYLEEYDELEYTDLSDEDYKRLLRCFLIENTPLGVVKMYYSNDDESFIYWSEKQVPYKVLEAVSRKYVIDYNCKNVHINMNEELEKQRQLLMNTKNDVEDAKDGADAADTADAADDKDSGDAKKSVFANFKKYNSGGSKTSVSKVGNKVKTKNVIVCDRANRYSYRGVYDENKNVVNKFPNADEVPETKKISVSDFLKHKKNYSSRYDENSNYDNNSDVSDKSGISNHEHDSSASDGFWRFLNIRYVAEDLNQSHVTEYKSEEVLDASGCFWINGKQYASRQTYHNAIVSMNTNAGVSSTDKDSDNSYDVLECETNNDSNKIPDSSTDSEDDEKNDVVESGMRHRTNSVASDVSNTSSGGMRSSWLGW